MAKRKNNKIIINLSKGDKKFIAGFLSMLIASSLTLDLLNARTLLLQGDNYTVGIFFLISISIFFLLKEGK